MATVGKTKLESGWLAARSTEVEVTGVQLTTTTPPSGPSAPWMEAAVPGTVLGTLLKNKLVPDPFYGLNNEAILDIADSGSEYYTFWFFTAFEAKLKENQHATLNFRAINYSGEVYLNGHKRILEKGMFRRHSLDITDILNSDGKNLLAVLIYPPDHPGTIPPQGGQGGDHEVYAIFNRNFTILSDTIEDRNTGIWDEVSLSITGPVKLADPHLVSSFFDNYKRSYLHTTVDLENKSSWRAECSLTIQVTAGLAEDVFLLEHLQSYELSIPPGSLVHYTLPPLFFYKPNLWWPNGMGKQSLYSIEISVDVKGFGESDSWSHQFGFRKIESTIDKATGGRYVWQEFWITGDCDGRGIPVSNPNGPLDHDLFLFCAQDTIKLLRNHASLALWVGGNEQTPPKDINTTLMNYLKLHPLFKSNEENSVAGEDLSQESTDPSQYLDGTRSYVQASMWDGFADGKGDFTDGPYEIQNPEDFFKDDFYQYGFNPEVGSVGMPVAATIRATMPPEGWQIPLFRKLSNGYIEEIPNPIWKYHKYIPYSNPGKVHDQIESYGHPKNLDDFCEKAQLVNYVQYKALLEGWTSRMWTKYTGVNIWKTQNPWTGLRGQFYDHLHDQTAGFYGCRSASEPIHVQLNLVTYYIEVVNTTSDELSDVSVEASVWDLDGKCPYYNVTEKLFIPSKKVFPVVEMKYPTSKNAKPVYFLLLKLFRLSDTSIISRNFYWLHQPDTNYNILEPYRAKKVPLKITSQTFITGSSYKIQMSVLNITKNSNSLDQVKEPEAARFKSGVLSRIFSGLQVSRSEHGSRVFEVAGSDTGVAFFLHFSVHDGTAVDEATNGDTRILPVHYSDNYFSLVPGESTTINISFEVPQGVTPRVVLQGWNYHGHGFSVC
ncbi:hypothetical protein KFK09_020663 [Dendrobium nobile]|uniref:Mannosylglycoprotein endo-beta-mannosidase n=1 Tax=Dendrobium nobile TaxID=94219 RepID=A0A8T3AN19_DENNO|nr:hypothetical protein KFK09_020663 [Dendrobium nobile]